MADLVSTGVSTANGAQVGGSAGSAYGGYGALIGGILGAAGGLAGGLLSSGGTSAAQMLDSLVKYYQPTKAGWSWAQLENQVAIEQFRKQLASSAQADLDLSKAMNMELPSSQVYGLKAAGINPILAVLGSGFSPIQSSASANGSGGASLPGGFTRSSRHINSAGSALTFAKILGGAIDSEVDNRRADTDNKRALTSNLHATNDLIEAQADNYRAQSEGIRDKIEHGTSSWSDLGREARTGIAKPLEEALTNWFKSFYDNDPSVNPERVSERSGNSAKNPGLTIEVNAPQSYDPEKPRYVVPMDSIHAPKKQNMSKWR